MIPEDVRRQTTGAFFWARFALGRVPSPTGVAKLLNYERGAASLG